MIDDRPAQEEWDKIVRKTRETLKRSRELLKQTQPATRTKHYWPAARSEAKNPASNSR